MIPSVFPTVSTTPYKVNTGIGSVLNINTYLKPSIPFLFRSTLSHKHVLSWTVACWL